MDIKWERYNYRIKCGQRSETGVTEIVNRIVNGYAIGVDLHDGNTPWPIGVHKDGHRWVLTDLISGLKVYDYLARPSISDITKCMNCILKFWRQVSPDSEFVDDAEKNAYFSICKSPIEPHEPFVPVNIGSGGYTWYNVNTECRCMRLKKGWLSEDVVKNLVL